MEGSEPTGEASLAVSSTAAAAVVRANRTRTLARLQAVVVLALLLPTIAYLAALFLLYQRQFADARVGLDRAVRVGAEHALKLFDTNEMLLQRMRDLLGERSEAELLQEGAALHEQLRKMASNLPQVQGLFVHGADSHMVATSRTPSPPRHINYTDRAWFQAHRRGEVTTFFTEQIVSRLTGEAAFDMSQRRVRPDGGFAGTLHVSLRPEYLTDFYKELAKADPGLRMTVLRNDGALIARWPGGALQAQPVPASDPLMKQIVAGLIAGESEAASPFDETTRLRSFRKLGALPLYVVASVNRSEVVAKWHQAAAVLALFVFPTAIGFAWMAWLALARTRDEFDAVQRLDEETARRQRAELGLVQSQKLEAIGRLTGGVAHDFNNLLAVVGNSLEVLRRLHPTLAETRQVEAIDRAVTSGVKLTRQLLAFARKQALLPERVRLQDRLAALGDLLRPLLGSSIRFELQVAPDTAAIEVDVAELELALINLAVNAGDAMQGRGALTLTARNALPADLPDGVQGEFVLIDVDDTGPGIDAAVAAQAFEPFFTTKPIGKGTGLGLSQVRGFCRSTGGDTLIARAPGGGTRVRMLLQQSHGYVSVAAAVTLPASPLAARVLLVEDNQAVAHATSELLDALGCRTSHVASGEEARRWIEAQTTPIDVVLSDIEMPGSIDGIALAAWLKVAHPELPIVLMTGYAPRLEQAMQQRLSVLPKPCSATVLAEALRRAMSTVPETPAVS